MSNTSARLSSLSSLSRFIPNMVSKRHIEIELLTHFSNIGVEVHPQEWSAKKIYRREGKEKTTLRKLASFDVGMNLINSIEAWQQTTKRGRVSIIQYELRFIIPFTSAKTLYRIPILTNAITVQDADRKTFQWNGFTWGKLPLLADRLKADNELNDNLQGFFYTGVLGELRIHAFSSDAISITTDCNLQRLPSRELLSCIECLARHVDSFVSEQNSFRDNFEETVKAKLFGSSGS